VCDVSSNPVGKKVNYSLTSTFNINPQKKIKTTTRKNGPSVSKETEFVTKLFEYFNINISYRTRKTIENFLNLHKSRNSLYEESGVYELKCQNCPGSYIGQTGRNFKTRYKEHIQK
jgi:hypothetical protein